MTRRFLFVGPSLVDASSVVPSPSITVCSPVASGDLMRLPVGRGDAVGIIDGYFHSQAAVRHKEILELIRNGVAVFGAASMGALRAAELERFGMQGVGTVFDDYRTGRLTADDEVALMHASEDDGYRALSEPLVNIRRALDIAVADALIERDHADELVARLGAMPYRDRGYQTVGLLVIADGWEPDAARRLVDHLVGIGADVKRDDLLELVRVLSGPVSAPPLADELPESLYVHRWRLGESGDTRVLRAAQVFDADFPTIYERTVLDRMLADCRDRCRTGGIVDVAGTGAALAHAYHVGIFDPDADIGELPFVLLWASPSERAGVEPRELLWRCLVRGFRIAPGIPPDQLVADRLRGSATWQHARVVVRRADEANSMAVNARDDYRSGAAVRSDVVEQWLATLWGRTVDEFELAALDRGFASRDAAITAGRWLFAYGLTRGDPRIGDRPDIAPRSGCDVTSQSPRASQAEPSRFHPSANGGR